MKTTTTETIQLRDTIRFRDTDGTIRTGYVCCLPSHPFSYGRFNVSVAIYQGLVSVRPEDVLGVVA